MENVKQEAAISAAAADYHVHDFSHVLNHLRQGYTARRRDWLKTQFLTLLASTAADIKLEKLMIVDGNNDNNYRAETAIAFKPTAEDVLATDWALEFTPNSSGSGTAVCDRQVITFGLDIQADGNVKACCKHGGSVTLNAQTITICCPACADAQ